MRVVQELTLKIHRWTDILALWVMVIRENCNPQLLEILELVKMQHCKILEALCGQNPWRYRNVDKQEVTEQSYYARFL